jgi:glycolate oxidase
MVLLLSNIRRRVCVVSLFLTMNADLESAMQCLQADLPGRVLLDKESRFSASYDNLRVSRLPDVVVRAQTADDVGRCLTIAHAHGISVTTRGAGSSSTGSAVPVEAGIVLDLSALRDFSIDLTARMVAVEAGVVTGELQAAVEAEGLFYPPDPSSKAHSTIGGNIACNAGGMRCLKYGVTRDYVVALEGFLADGSPFRWGLPLRKYVSGFNMRDLFIGSEGMLGVVTKAWLRLLPLPKVRWTAMFAFADEETALEAGVLRLLEAGFTPSILEFLDRQSVTCAEQRKGQPVFPGEAASALLLIEFDGMEQVKVEQQGRDLIAFLQPVSRAHRVAANAAEAESIWQVRRTCSQSMFALGDTKLNEDVVVPLDKQSELLRKTLQLRDQIGLATPTFGHAGDGNLHVHIMYNRNDPEHAARAKVGIRQLMESVVALGGVITGEHGIGLAKSSFFDLQHSPAEIAAMQAVKNALDPKGILNPGKMFTPFEVWNETPVDVAMPWDHR